MYIVNDCINYIIKCTDFRFNIIQPVDNYFGVVDANGSWLGIIGMLSRKVNIIE